MPSQSGRSPGAEDVSSIGGGSSGSSTRSTRSGSGSGSGISRTRECKRISIGSLEFKLGRQIA